jgi:hypothetical protein
MDINQIVRAETRASTVPDRLRWTAEFLDLASKAIAIIACAQGLDCPPDLHHAPQQDLRAWARYLDDHPMIAADLELASVLTGVPVSDR